MNIKPGICLSVFVLLISSAAQADSSKLEELNMRVTALEQYAETIQPTFVDFSQKISASIQEYTQGLETSLEQYTNQLQSSLDQRIKGVTSQSIVLDINSRSYRKIETNSGYFLIAVESVKPIDSGYAIQLQIGNPYYADFKGVKFTLTWGPKWFEGVKSFEQWRSELVRGEFQYNGSLVKSAWNPMRIEIPVSNPSQLAYIELEMSVSSIELESLK